jgi:peptidoglycan hydrolase CwlO-like protein
MAMNLTSLVKEITEGILSFTAGESNWTMPSCQGELVNKDMVETESYQNTSKELKTEISRLRRHVRELQSHVRQNEYEIKDLHNNIQELREVVRELIERAPENDESTPLTTKVNHPQTETEGATLTKEEVEEIYTTGFSPRYRKI